MQKFEVKNHEPSYLPDGEWQLVWFDEFDGTELDRTKWDFRLDFWGEKNFPAFTDKGIVLDGKSHLEMHRVEFDGRYVSPQLQTGENTFDLIKPDCERTSIWPFEKIKEPKFVHRYGYYECLCKFQKDPQLMWSAFWMQSPSIGASYDPAWCGIESDIMECFKPGIATTGNISGGYGKNCHEEGRVTYNLEETEGGWHYFGMDWSPDGYKFYCDGKQVSESNGPVSRVPQFILLTTEIYGYRFSKPKYIEGEFEDDAFIVDHVRVFDRK